MDNQKIESTVINPNKLSAKGKLIRHFYQGLSGLAIGSILIGCGPANSTTTPESQAPISNIPAEILPVQNSSQMPGVYQGEYPSAVIAVDESGFDNLVKQTLSSQLGQTYNSYMAEVQKYSPEIINPTNSNKTELFAEVIHTSEKTIQTQPITFKYRAEGKLGLYTAEISLFRTEKDGQSHLYTVQKYLPDNPEEESFTLIQKVTNVADPDDPDDLHFVADNGNGTVTPILGFSNVLNEDGVAVRDGLAYGFTPTSDRAYIEENNINPMGLVIISDVNGESLNLQPIYWNDNRDFFIPMGKVLALEMPVTPIDPTPRPDNNETQNPPVNESQPEAIPPPTKVSVVDLTTNKEQINNTKLKDVWTMAEANFPGATIYMTDRGEMCIKTPAGLEGCGETTIAENGSTYTYLITPALSKSMLINLAEPGQQDNVVVVPDLIGNPMKQEFMRTLGTVFDKHQDSAIHDIIPNNADMTIWQPNTSMHLFGIYGTQSEMADFEASLDPNIFASAPKDNKGNMFYAGDASGIFNNERDRDFTPILATPNSSFIFGYFDSTFAKYKDELGVPLKHVLGNLLFQNSVYTIIHSYQLKQGAGLNYADPQAGTFKNVTNTFVPLIPDRRSKAEWDSPEFNSYIKDIITFDTSSLP